MGQPLADFCSIKLGLVNYAFFRTILGLHTLAPRGQPRAAASPRCTSSAWKKTRQKGSAVTSTLTYSVSEGAFASGDGVSLQTQRATFS